MKITALLACCTLLIACCQAEPKPLATAHTSQPPPSPSPSPTNSEETPPSPMTKEPQEVEELLVALDSPDPHVRSRAALSLHRMKHPKALEACLKTLNDGEDMLHLDYTPSVRCLSEIGQPALLPLIDYLTANDSITRLRAQRAIEEITTRMFGFDGSKWPADKLNEWRTWWSGIGYDYDAESGSREASVARLRSWAVRQ